MGSIAESLGDVRRRLSAASSSAGRASEPNLVAVSKTKPVELLAECYAAGQRQFGENYVQEIVAKAPQMPADVVWRFIGGLQSNKAKELVHGVPSLAVVETLDSKKLADKLQKAVSDLQPPRASPLGVMIQVNTSPWEGTKGGVLAGEELADLATHVATSCAGLKLVGLMTIGEAGNSACFSALVEARAALATVLGVGADTLELSMGMSADFEAAIAAGSDSVRVGSSIFGARSYPGSKPTAANA